MRNYIQAGRVAQFISSFSFVTVLAVSGLTYAQEAADDEALEEIIITGTHIRGSTTTGALPISVLDRDDFEALGAPTTTDIVNDAD